MKKRKLKLVEIILIVVIALVVIAIAVPNIINLFKDNDTDEEKTVEEVLVENLEAYNKKYEQDLWCLDDTDKDGCYEDGELYIDFNEDLRFYTDYDSLASVNSNIDLGDCLLIDTEALSIVRGSNGEYTYNARIVCSPDFKDKDYSVAEVDDLENANIYYRTGE